MNHKLKSTIKTLILSILLTIVNAISALILQRLVIETYGSSVNGLISTLTQFVALFSVIEGGFTTAAIVATYTPIIEKDYKELNEVLFNAKRILERVGGIIFFGAITLGAIYISFIDGSIEYSRMLFLLIECAVASVISVSVVATYSILLQGDNKEYIVNTLTLISRVLTSGLAVVLIHYKVNICFYFASYIAYPLMTALLLWVFVRSRYTYATFSGNVNKSIVAGTNDVMLQKIANTIFTSTDLILISVFLDLVSASIYNVYFQIFKMIQILLNSLIQAPFNSFGQLLHSNEKKNVGVLFHLYQSFVMATSTSGLTTISIVILPFINLYVESIDDVQYISPILVLLFYSQFFAQINNRPYGTILNAAGLFNKQNIQCVIAAIVNLVISIAFIKKFGLVSVIMGSVVATCIILIANMYQTYRNITCIGWQIDIIKMVTNYIIGIIIIGVTFLYVKELFIQSYLYLFMLAIIVFIVTETFFLFYNFLLDRNRMVVSIKLLSAHLHNKS